MQFRQRLVMGALGLALALASPLARAHCDALDGPVARDARQALDKGEAGPVLKWVGKADEAEARDAFRKTLAVRAGGSAARELADRYFLEALVRLHRAGEGEPFTGLKPAGSIEPGLAAADAALESGKVAGLREELAAAIRNGVEQRFQRAQELRRHAADSVEAGRAYVAAYVDYVHFVESVHRLGTAEGQHGHGDAPAHP
jgi:hypothetical protein